MEIGQTGKIKDKWEANVFFKKVSIVKGVTIDRLFHTTMLSRPKVRAKSLMEGEVWIELGKSSCQIFSLAWTIDIQLITFLLKRNEQPDSGLVLNGWNLSFLSEACRERGSLAWAISWSNTITTERKRKEEKERKERRKNGRREEGKLSHLLLFYRNTGLRDSMVNLLIFAGYIIVFWKLLFCFGVRLLHSNIC